jgi:hypothetical protein
LSRKPHDPVWRRKYQTEVILARSPAKRSPATKRVQGRSSIENWKKKLLEPAFFFPDFHHASDKDLVSPEVVYEGLPGSARSGAVGEAKR